MSGVGHSLIYIRQIAITTIQQRLCYNERIIEIDIIRYAFISTSINEKFPSVFKFEFLSARELNKCLNYRQT